MMILFLAFWLAFQMKVTSGKAFFWFALVLREKNVLFMTVNGKLSDLWQQRMIQRCIGTSLRSVASFHHPENVRVHMKTRLEQNQPAH